MMTTMRNMTTGRFLCRFAIGMRERTVALAIRYTEGMCLGLLFHSIPLLR
jgi:hypothetical protein